MEDKKIRTGHYLRKDLRKSLSQVKNSLLNNDELSECPYDAADIFLQGSCQMFSLVLNREFHYPAYKISFGRSFHCFCMEIKNGVKIYIDVRGATDDFEEFIRDTYLPNNAQYIIELQNLEEDSKLQEEYDEIGMAFAQEIVTKYRDYYDIR